jgi:hypothetical protein
MTAGANRAGHGRPGGHRDTTASAAYCISMPPLTPQIWPVT